MRTDKKMNRKIDADIIKAPKAPPQYLTATSGDISGEIDLVWEPVKDARTYVIQKSAAKNNWIQEDIVTRSSYTITKLKSGRNYRFRVAAVDSKGQGPWSEPVEKKVP